MLSSLYCMLQENQQQNNEHTYGERSNGCHFGHHYAITAGILWGIKAAHQSHQQPQHQRRHFLLAAPTKWWSNNRMIWTLLWPFSVSINVHHVPTYCNIKFTIKILKYSYRDSRVQAWFDTNIATANYTWCLKVHIHLCSQVLVGCINVIVWSVCIYHITGIIHEGKCSRIGRVF